MINPFYYRAVGEGLFGEVCQKLSNGESTVLLSPRFGGSRYALYRLHGLLKTKGIFPLVYVKLARHDEASKPAVVRKLVAEAVTETTGKGIEPGGASDPLLEAVDRLQADCDKPVVLVVANVDYLPYHLSSRLLEEVRTRDQAGRVIALLSGESHFYDLVYGPKSEFNCANQFVLQGLSLDEFRRFAEQYLSSLPLKLADPLVIDEIWTQTGGNRHMLRILLWEVLERLSRRSGDAPLGVTDIRTLIESSRLPGPYGSEVFRYQVRLISHEPRSWCDLKGLIAESSIELGLDTGPPTPLELAGVAIRRGSRLVFSSPWMRAYIQQHFDNRRWGDLYARNGDWTQAFAHYGELEPDETVRPSTAEDRLEVEITIRSLSAALYADMHNGTDSLCRLFTQGCRHILGFQEIAFWSFRHSKWSMELTEDSYQGKRYYLQEAASFLPPGGFKVSGILSIPTPWRRLAVAAAFPGLRADQQYAVVLSNFEQRTFISKERERLTHEIIDQFLKAYDHALAIERDRERLATRNRHIDVMNSIFSALGGKVLNVNSALALAAGGLRRLGYSRVLFCLVNPTDDRIVGEIDDSDDPRVNVASMTNWALDPPGADIQPYVIFTRKPKIVEDARREPLANLKVVYSTEMKAFALVPILTQEEVAIGTIHVERKDGVVPSDDEVEDLLLFGRQLAIAIEQSERVNLLQAALDKIPEPVMIADRLMRPHFMNAPAADLLELQAGWYDRNNAPVLSEENLGMVGALLKSSLEQGQRLVRQIHEVRPEQGYRGVALADAITDWKGRTVGTILHFQDLNYLYGVLAAFRLIAEADDTKSATRAVLEAFRGLGHKKGRLFLADEDDPGLLVRRFTLEPDGEIAEDPYSPEKVVLPRREDLGYWTWMCIEERTPMVFCWKPDQVDSAKIITSFGLEATNSNPPKCPNEQNKEPGDFWIDFPLITPQEILGKLSLSCDPALKPEDFHLLRMLSEMAAGLLDAFIRRERMLKQVEDRVLGPAAEQAMAVAAHNIATRLASLPLLLERYRRRQMQYPELTDLNDTFEHTVTEVLRIIHRIKERLASVKVEFRRVDLLSMVRNAFNGALGSHQWRIVCEHNDLEADADTDLLENALLELIQNSREMIKAKRDLFVSISLAALHGKTGEWVKLTYSDNGPGIPDHLKVRIFEPFFSRRPGQKSSGGLGLAFVQRVVSGHGGAVVENGRQEVGAQFVLAFPRFARSMDKEVDHV